MSDLVLLLVYFGGMTGLLLVGHIIGHLLNLVPGLKSGQEEIPVLKRKND